MLQELTIEEVKDYVKDHPEAKFIDVREQEEWDQGHIEGATLMPLSAFGSHIPELLALAEHHLLIMYCARGGRSHAASQFLLEENPNLTVVNMLGGYTEWSAPHISS